ncbi:hypothetical protein SASPL_120347 [Salvia splendens]|uniref:DUF8040 domain-containing protein n=1 Tax=Salvia splendens TaxID=180675 RepID=A0A8X8XQM8_SALSN|nr:hypothetical protein SASPL_120347 [Salvia splendens]
MLPVRSGSHERDAVSLVVEEYQEVNRVKRLLFIAILECMRDYRSLRQRRLNVRPYRILERVPAQVAHVTRLVGLTDVDCINNLRMDRNTFGRLCILLRERTSLIDGRWVTVEEQVAMFLCVLAHHSKNRIVGFNFRRHYGKHVKSFIWCDDYQIRTRGATERVTSGAREVYVDRLLHIHVVFMFMAVVIFLFGIVIGRLL